MLKIQEILGLIKVKVKMMSAAWGAPSWEQCPDQGNFLKGKRFVYDEDKPEYQEQWRALVMAVRT